MSDPGDSSAWKKKHQDLPLWKSAVGLCSATWARAALLCLAESLVGCNKCQVDESLFHMKARWWFHFF